MMGPARANRLKLLARTAALFLAVALHMGALVVIGRSGPLPQSRDVARETIMPVALRPPTVKPPVQPPPRQRATSRPSAQTLPVAINPAPAVSPGDAPATPGPISATPASPALGEAMRALRCNTIDPQQRPPDCPANQLARQALEAADRPASAEARGRTTPTAMDKVVAREIPPPCPTCPKFGITPPKPRTPKELCELRGLGPCVDPPEQDRVMAQR